MKSHELITWCFFIKQNHLKIFHKIQYLIAISIKKTSDSEKANFLGINLHLK